MSTAQKTKPAPYRLKSTAAGLTAGDRAGGPGLFSVTAGIVKRLTLMRG